MKYLSAVLFVFLNMIMHSAPGDASMGEEDEATPNQMPPHQSSLPSCEEIIACMSCCCQSAYILLKLSLQSPPQKIPTKYYRDDHKRME